MQEIIKSTTIRRGIRAKFAPMKHAMRHYLLYASLLLFASLGNACRNENTKLDRNKQPAADQGARPSKGNNNATGTTTQVPAYVLETLAYVRNNNRAPEGFVGGRTFENREKRLPQKAPDGSKVRYREWDVHPKVRGQNRGAERLVTGSDQSAWYTADHYKRFSRIE
jgi:ribonuclease T1